MKGNKDDSVAKLFEGRWRIIDLPDIDGYDVETEDQPGYIEFLAKGRSSFGIVVVEGVMDTRIADVAGIPVANFAWEGHDEEEALHGRGTANINQNGTLTGTISVFDGDTYDFMAEKELIKSSGNSLRKAPARKKGK